MKKTRLELSTTVAAPHREFDGNFRSIVVVVVVVVVATMSQIRRLRESYLQIEGGLWDRPGNFARDELNKTMKFARRHVFFLCRHFAGYWRNV